MRPQNKRQARVYALSTKLKPLTASNEAWVMKNVLSHEAFANKKETCCMDCGFKWKTKEEEKTKCGNCKATLEVVKTLKHKVNQREYFSKLEVQEEFQVIRIFEIESFYRKGEKCKTDICEVSQLWIDPKGKYQIVSRSRMLNFYSDKFHGELTIKNPLHVNKYNIYTGRCLPKKKIIPNITRNGFKGDFYGITAFNLFVSILTNSKAETLLKSNQISALRHLNNVREFDIENNWKHLKKCIKNNYQISNAGTYFDYIQMLVNENIDLNNIQNICPPNLVLAHDLLAYKITERQRTEREEEEKRKKEYNQEAYKKDKQKFFGLIFEKDNLKIKVLETIEEFQEEGKAHKHCVFSSSYYDKKESLVLSASVDNVPVETVEISLTKFKIIQSRGFENKPSIHNKEIIDLVNKNIKLIKKISKITL